ncbi:hypothetical protein HY449_02250 [Candidatus Pacearchaeota archaeon]|nr:hypothetical protein [Candidatus Pacearchaeota archaeon]
MADKKVKGIFIPEDEVNEILGKIDKVLNPNKRLWKDMKDKEKLALMDKILSKSELTEKDVEDIGEKIKRGIAKKHGL